MTTTNSHFPSVATIGVYGFDEKTFYDTLVNADVDLFCDIRMRRGMRGSQYAFVNSSYLQDKLKQLGISYIHSKDLAPSNEIREMQKDADARSGVLKSTRTRLGEVFADEYKAQCLKDFDSQRFLKSLPGNTRKVVFFCVEREPQACHRSLVTNRLSLDLGLTVEHLLP